MAKTIYVLNGPDLNRSGTREREADEHLPPSDIEKLCAATAEQYGLCTDCRHPNGEDELIGFIREAQEQGAVGLILDAGGYAQGSSALHTALMAVQIPIVELQTGNAAVTENVRHFSFAVRPAFATLRGFGIDSYRLAITGLAARIGTTIAAA